MIRRFLCCGVLAVAAGGAAPQAASPAAPPATVADVAQFPDTPAGREMSAWLSAFNSQDLAVYRGYIERRAPALLKYVRNDHDFALAVGGFSLLRIDDGDGLTLTGLLSEPYADFPTTFSIRLDADPPHAVLELELGPATRPDDMPIAVLDEPGLVRALESRLRRQSDDDRFSGVVLLARGNRILFERAYGFADRERRSPNTVDTRFRIASMGKMFTAVSVMQLAAAGKLDLQAPIARVLPDYPNADIARAVTLHQLLTHTGGTGDIFVPEIESRRDRIRDHADYIRILGERPPEFPPGSRWSYSNYGYVLLGRAIERASGEDYFDYVRRHVFAPAGMRYSGTPAIAGGASDPALGYSRGGDGGAWVPAPRGMPEVASAAGGELATARDLYRFVRALQSGRLLGRAAVARMLRGTVDAPFGRYAYGFKDQHRDGLRYVGHGGSAPGSNGELDLYPDTGHIVVVLTNQDPPYGNRVAEFIGNRLAAAHRSRD